jgi:hypothetical protein
MMSQVAVDRVDSQMSQSDQLPRTKVELVEPFVRERLQARPTEFVSLFDVKPFV